MRIHFHFHSLNPYISDVHGTGGGDGGRYDIFLWHCFGAWKIIKRFGSFVHLRSSAYWSVVLYFWPIKVIWLVICLFHIALHRANQYVIKSLHFVCFVESILDIVLIYINNQHAKLWISLRKTLTCNGLIKTCSLGLNWLQLLLQCVIVNVK